MWDIGGEEGKAAPNHILCAGFAPVLRRRKSGANHMIDLSTPAGPSGFVNKLLLRINSIRVLRVNPEWTTDHMGNFQRCWKPSQLVREDPEGAAYKIEPDSFVIHVGFERRKKGEERRGTTVLRESAMRRQRRGTSTAGDCRRRCWSTSSWCRGK